MTLTRRLLVLLAIPALLLAACGSGDDGPGELTVSDARIDLPANPDVAAVYLVIDNGTDLDDVLTGVTSVVGDASIHRTEIVDGFSTMEHLDELPIPAGESVTFEPLGLHVMLDGIEDPLEIGGGVPLTFIFAEAGEIEVVAEVVEPGASSRAADDPNADAHDHGDDSEGDHQDDGAHDHG